nr:UDP-N-acetylglucosamine 1-carboxyvinyltransferase [uncultured Solibaculum sp.]
MSKLIVQGGHRLTGSIPVHGAKNSALPLLSATLLGATPSVLHNCPRLSDVDTSIKILSHLGCKVTQEGSSVTVDASTAGRYEIPDDLMREMRSSVVFLGAIVARQGRARISFPGGCELGPRPIDLHLKALRKLGLIIEEDHGYLNCHVGKGLKGCPINLSFPSVGATENIMLASATATGTTIITNAAREPEICDLANFLNQCGAHICGAGESTIRIDGVPKLHGAEHTVIADRITATTYMAAAAVTGGDLILEKVIPAHLEPVIPVFEEAGCHIKTQGDQLHIVAPDRMKAVKNIRTLPYPGFPTDSQAIVMAMSTLAEGTSVFVENIFESRYKHVGELLRLGAHIKVEGKVAIVEGMDHLSGAPVEAADLRGAAALVVAGLAAQGTTQITGLHHLDRGYEMIEQRLSGVGAVIKRD